MVTSLIEEALFIHGREKDKLDGNLRNKIKTFNIRIYPATPG